MSPKDPSFTAYDFLGYAVPGLGALVLFDATIYCHVLGNHLNYDLLCSRYMQAGLATIVPVLLISYLMGHILGFVSSVVIEKHATWMHGVPTNVLLGHGQHFGYFDTAGDYPRFSKALRLISAILIAPLSLIDCMFARVIPLSKNYIKALDPILISVSAAAHRDILKKFSIDFEKYSEEEKDGLDLHAITIHCALESAPAHVFSVRNYVVLYGFLRSIALLVVFAFWVAVIHFFQHPHLGVFGALVLLGALSFICYAAYLKFRVRYHKEGIMALIASYALRNAHEKN
jgi:hypothetical protein